MCELLRLLAAAAGTAAPPTSSGTEVPTTAVLTTPAQKKAKAFFCLKAPALLRSSGDDSKAAQLRHPLLWRLGQRAAQKGLSTIAVVLALLRAAAPKEQRLTNRAECTCDRGAVAYTRSARP